MKNYLNKLKLPVLEEIIWSHLYLAGYQVYLVGGAVRDIVLGIEPNDFDFATNATPKEIKKVFRYTDHKVDFVGESFGVTLVDGVEVATFRGDEYHGDGCRDVAITYVDTIEEDLSRRDFTINAMALDKNGNLIDPFGGVNDLLKRPEQCVVVRFVGDAQKRIWEDPNRIIRAFRFVARFQGTLDEESFQAIVDNRDRFSLIAPERVRLEILKTLETSKEASLFWNLMRISGVLDVFIPELVQGHNHDHGNHHSEDIWLHNMIAGDAVSTKFPLVKFAAYLHDIGKPASFDPELGTFYQHQHFGADITRNRLYNLKLSNEEIRHIVNLILVHMDGTRGMSSKSRRRLKNKLAAYGIEWREYVRLRIADRTANIARPNFTISDIREYIEIFTLAEEVPVSVNSLALSGGQLIEIFNLTPGPIVGKIQRELLKFVIDEGDEYNSCDFLLGQALKEFDIDS